MRQTGTRRAPAASRFCRIAATLRLPRVLPEDDWGMGPLPGGRRDDR